MARICLLIVTLVVITTTCTRTAHAAHILMSALYGEGSHFLVASAIGQSLVDRGHDVTFLIGEAYADLASDPAYANFSFEVFQHSVPNDEIRYGTQMRPQKPWTACCNLI